MIIIDEIKNSEDYPNNMQRNICADEINKAKNLYYDFESWFNKKCENISYIAVVGQILHHTNIHVDSVEDEYTNIIYGDEHKDGVSVFLSIANRNNKPYLCKNFDIYVNGLDYEYNVDIDEI